MRFVLASKSPRRLQLLQMIGVKDLLVMPAVGQETVPNLPHDEAIAAVAMAKAREVSKKCNSGDIIIAADTLVYLDDKVLGKPENEKEAIEMLHELSGREHTVRTGVAVLKDGAGQAETEKSRVLFRRLTDDEVRAYVKTGEPLDKAGAYGAQGIGALFVEKIDGDFFNVMGLPLCRLNLMLSRFGVPLL